MGEGGVVAVLFDESEEFVRRFGILGGEFGFAREEFVAANLFKGRDGAAVGICQALDGAGRGGFEGEGFEQALTEDAREQRGDVGLGREEGTGHFVGGGFGADAAGVAIEGVVVDAEAVELELLMHAAIGGRLAVDDGDVDLTTQGGIEAAVDDAVGVVVVLDGRVFVFLVFVFVLFVFHGGGSALVV